MHCTSCGKELEPNCAFCSGCGSPVSDESEVPNETASESAESAGPEKKKPLIVKLLYAIGAIILVLAFIKSLDPYGNILGVDTLREVYSCSQEVICDEVLLDPAGAEFPKFDPDYVTRSSEKLTYEGVEYYVYTVSAYVDSNNAFGARFRQKYTVEIGLPVDTSIDGYYYNIISVG